MTPFHSVPGPARPCPAPGQELLPAVLASGSHAPLQPLQTLPALVFVQPGPAGGRVGRGGGRNVCRPGARPAAASLAASLPAYGSPGDTPVGRQERRLVGPRADTCVGRGEALHVRRAGASLSLPCPAPHHLHCSQSLPELSPKARRAVHYTRVDLGFLCAEAPKRAAGRGSPQAAGVPPWLWAGQAEARPGRPGHGPGADRYSGRPAPRLPWRPRRGPVGPRCREGAGLGPKAGVGAASHPRPAGPDPVGAGQCGRWRWGSLRAPPWAEGLPRHQHRGPLRRPPREDKGERRWQWPIGPQRPAGPGLGKGGPFLCANVGPGAGCARDAGRGAAPRPRTVRVHRPRPQGQHRPVGVFSPGQRAAWACQLKVPAFRPPQDVLESPFPGRPLKCRG